jgi:hypothetical protein
MYCSYCGTALADDAVFCTSCGKKVTSAQEQANTSEQEAQLYQAKKSAVRKSEMDALTAAHSHFSQKTETFQRYDYVCNRLKYYARGARSALLVWGCIIATFAFAIMLVLLEDRTSPEPVVFAGLIPGLLMILGGVLMKINNRSKYNRFKNRHAELSEELFDHYNSYPDCPVGPEYANPQILQYILGVLQSGRADTVKESINLAVDAQRQVRIQEHFGAIKRHAAPSVTAFFAPASFFF